MESQLPDYFANFATDSVEKARQGEDERGLRMASRLKDKVDYKGIEFSHCRGEWILPKEPCARPRLIFYLHGGGYTAGSLMYSRGFGTNLAARTGADVLTLAYRLAPENRYPAALSDAMEAYLYLLSVSDAPIYLAGESSGGGMCFALAMKIRDQGLPMPEGIIAASPWADLTLSDIRELPGKDPSLTLKTLRLFASSYAEDLRDPYVSPLFGSFEKMPKSLLFAGGNELVRPDAERLFRALSEAGCEAKLYIAPDLWHAYILEGGRAAIEDYERIIEFLQ